MEIASNILKNLVLVQLEKDANFARRQTSDFSWTKFTADFLNYEIDPKPIFAELYRLELDDPERIISKIPGIYNNFLEELAEQYVLGVRLEAMDLLIQNDDALFRKYVTFYNELKNAVTRMERRRMVEEIPSAYSALSNEISDDAIQAAIKKKGREDLRAKFKTWDQEIRNEELEKIPSNIQFNMESSLISKRKEVELPSKSNQKKDKGKVISLTWIKYAVAACVLIAAGLFYFDSPKRPFSSGNEMVDVDDMEETEGIDENFPSAELVVSEEELQILQNEGLGFSESSSEAIIRLNFIDANERIYSLREILKREEVDMPNIKEELSLLQNRQSKYIFQDHQLTFYQAPFEESAEVIQLKENQYYLHKGTKFYYLNHSNTPQELVQETDEGVREELERIIFINE